MSDLDELIAEARRLEGDYGDSYEVVTHMSVLADAALARITDLEQSLRIASLGRRVDATLLHEYERRFAEAAKLHRKGGMSQGYTADGYGYIEHCCETCGTFGEYGEPWPCPTAVALGLNEGENE